MATGLGTTTGKLVFKKGGELSSPEKRYRKSRVRVYPDDFDRVAIRRSIHDVYDHRVSNIR